MIHLLLSLPLKALDSYQNEQAALNCVNDSQVFIWKPAHYISHFTITITFSYISNSSVIRDDMLMHKLISSESTAGFVA